jgi:hypothetical protein
VEGRRGGGDESDHHRFKPLAGASPADGQPVPVEPTGDDISAGTGEVRTIRGADCKVQSLTPFCRHCAYLETSLASRPMLRASPLVSLRPTSVAAISLGLRTAAVGLLSPKVCGMHERISALSRCRISPLSSTLEPTTSGRPIELQDPWAFVMVVTTIALLTPCQM